jgi:thioredoxin-like negative regulator of GroEL
MRVIKALILSLPSMGLLSGSLVTTLALNAVATSAAYAKSEKQVSSKVGKPLQEAMTLAQSGKLKDAMAKVQEAAAVSGKTTFEEFKINEIMAFIAVKLGDYATAAKAYESTLQSGELPPEQAKERVNQLVKLYYQLNNYPKAIQYGSQYLKEGGNDTSIAVLVAQAYYQQKDYAHGAEAAQSLIRMANQSGQPVQEPWLQLLMNCQVNSGKEDEAVGTLEQLVAKYPNKQYWNQLLGYVQTHGGSSDRKNLEVYRLKLVNGLLKDSEYVEMAQLSMALGFPGDAKNVLDKGFNEKILGVGPSKDRETRLLTLAQTNAAADQKSLPTFEKEAIAAASGDGDVKLGETFLSYGDYAKAMEAIKRGLKKGNVKSVDEANLQLGQALLGAKQTNEAINAFKAVPADSKLASITRLWFIYANGKK